MKRVALAVAPRRLGLTAVARLSTLLKATLSLSKGRRCLTRKAQNTLRAGIAAGAAAAALAVVAVEARPLAIGSIHVYQRALSPIAARVGLVCRFNPTCSRYAETVIERDGVVRGGWKAVKRIARCGPWTARGTHDEP